MNTLPQNFPRNLCAFCGSMEDLSKDHVPPKNLFPKPRPSDLITVSACSKCHSRTSKDDEYFRLNLCFRDDIGKHSSARANWDSIFRSLKREEAKGLRNMFLNNLINIRLYTPLGIDVERGFAYNVDMNRIRSVVERTVRGLFFAESCQSLEYNNEIRIYSDDDLEIQPPDVIEQLIQKILVPLHSIPLKKIGNEVFIYRHQIMSENPIYSVWFVSFYSKISFLCMTGPST